MISEIAENPYRNGQHCRQQGLSIAADPFRNHNNEGVRQSEWQQGWQDADQALTTPDGY
jgi:hypothetical protein